MAAIVCFLHQLLGRFYMRHMIRMLGMRDRALLCGNFLDTALDVETPVLLVHAGYKERSVCEEIVHLLKRALGSLGQEAVKEDGVREVAYLWIWSVLGQIWVAAKRTYDEEQIEPPTCGFHSKLSDLANQSVEGKGRHGGDRYTLGTGFGIEDLGRNDPRQRSTSGAETEIVQPSNGDETPRSSSVSCRARREHSQHDGGDNEGKAVTKVTADQSPAASQSIDEGNTECLSAKSKNRRDGLVFERVGAANTHLLVDGN